MARNEEKQLARLNRYYLQQQKEEELKKRPPRPKLDTLNTPREIRKWLPTITRDIDFYVKQMEVACYPESKVGEFSERIGRLKGEYRAYLRKLRALEPDLDAAPWTNRPYSGRKRHAEDVHDKPDQSTETDQPQAKTSPEAPAAEKFVPLSTPLLQHLAQVLPTQYGFERPAPVVWNANPDTENKPLDFAPSRKLPVTDSHGAEVVHPHSGVGVRTLAGSTRTEYEESDSKYQDPADSVSLTSFPCDCSTGNEPDFVDSVSKVCNSVHKCDTNSSSDTSAVNNPRCSGRTPEETTVGQTRSNSHSQFTNIICDSKDNGVMECKEAYSVPHVVSCRFHSSKDTLVKSDQNLQIRTSVFTQSEGSDVRSHSLTNPLKLDYSDSSESEID